MTPTADNLNYYGQYLLDYLMESRPDIYKELQDEGVLISFCQSREDRAIAMRNRLMDQGRNWAEAEEVVIPDLLAFSEDI